MKTSKVILAAVADMCGSSATLEVLAAATEQTSITVHYHVQRHIKKGLMSRGKVESKPFYQYYMTQAQLDSFHSGAAGNVLDTRKPRQSRKKVIAPTGPVAVKPEDDTFCLITDTLDIPGRLKFLRHLKDATFFGGNHTLDLIISDYSRTMSMREACVARMEEAE